MKTRAFTRIEFLAVLGTCGLLSVVGMSLMADTRERSERLVCMNNLRQVGRALQEWGADHGGSNPWRVRQADGGTANATSPFQVPGVGTYPAGFTQNLWFHFLWVHQELRSPSILVCPSDGGKRRAASFANTPGGFAHFTMMNSAVSYGIGLDTPREWTSAILSTDRNLTTMPGTTACSSGINAGRTIRRDASGWEPFVHGRVGNLLLNDGRVAQMSPPELQSYLMSSNEDDFPGQFHVMLP